MYRRGQSNVTLMITEMVNLALGKPAYQSALWETWTDASRAVDGNKDTDLLEGRSCSHTGTSLHHNWWHVDILEAAVVYEVRITNRGGNVFICL